MKHDEYKFELIFDSKTTKKTLHRLEKIISKKETQDDYKDEEIFRQDIDNLNDRLIQALKLFGQKWVIMKGENRTKIKVFVSENEFDLRLVVTLQQLVLSVENHPNIYQFELIQKESLQELNWHLITRLNKQYSNVVYVISSYHDKNQYFIIYEKLDNIIRLPLKHKWEDNTGKKHDILNIIKEVNTVNLINNLTTTAVTYIKSTNHLKNIITEYTNYYNVIQKRYDDLMDNLDIVQGLEDRDNPNLDNDLLLKMNKVYVFEQDNEHDRRVFEHSVLHYHRPTEGVKIGYIMVKHRDNEHDNKTYVVITNRNVLLDNLELNKNYLNKQYGDKFGVIKLKLTSDYKKEVEGYGIYLEESNKDKYERIITDILSIVIRGKPIYD